MLTCRFPGSWLGYSAPGPIWRGRPAKQSLGQGGRCTGQWGQGRTATQVGLNAPSRSEVDSTDAPGAEKLSTDRMGYPVDSIDAPNGLY